MKKAFKNLEKMIRPELLSLEAYPASPTLAQLAGELRMPAERIVKLNSAENSSVERFYPKNIKSFYYAYPDPYCIKLRQAIGQYTGFSPEWIACGNGSDELIDLLIALFVGKDEEVLLSPPTFPVYEFCCKVRGVKIKKVPRNRKLEIDAKKLSAAISKKTKLIFIDSPGNPAGTLVRRQDLISLLKKQVVVVVDEAYFEYSGQTVASLVRKFPNLIVFRSFSKWAGLAGLRVGYMIANPKVIQAFMLIKPPYNVNVIAQELALVALKKKKQILKKLDKLLLVKRRVVKALSKIKNVKVLAGKGSYIMIQLKNEHRQEVISSLRSKGILVKAINQPGLENSFLASMESSGKMNKLVKFLKVINNI